MPQHYDDPQGIDLLGGDDAPPEDMGTQSAGRQNMMMEPQQAPPEEQEAYEHFVAQAWNIVYDREMMPRILKMLEGEGDPMEGLARAAALVVARVASSAEQNGVVFSPEVGLHAGTEIFEDLAELSRLAGIKDYSTDEDAMEGAYFRALDHFRLMMTDAGKINPEAAQQDMATLQQMDERGELEAMFSGLARNDRRAEMGGDMPTEETLRGLMTGAM